MKQLWILPLVLLAACGKPVGKVEFRGETPRRPQDPDLRSAVTYCGGCGKAVDFKKTQCDKKECKAKLTWADTYPCGFCGATGECLACSELGQKDQTCFNCRGEGFITYEGKTRACSHCAGTKKCQVCKEAPGKCDACKGNKKLSQEEIAKLIEKASKRADDK
jgi:hypothetical protein